MEAIVDTNVLLGDYLEDSEFHERAKGILDSLNAWLVPSVVIEEFVYSLRQLGVSDNLIGRKAKELLEDERMNVVPIGRSDIANSVDILESEKISFGRFNDKLILSVAVRRRRSLATFDRALKSECSKLKVSAIH